MLKDNVAVNNTWTDTYNNITLPSFPIPVTVKIDYTLVEKAVPAIVNNFSFQDVIKVKAVISAGALGTFTPQQQIDTWYARGTGIIYSKTTSLTTTGTFTEQKVRRFTIF